jgi:hypothetical protein
VSWATARIVTGPLGLKSKKAFTSCVSTCALGHALVTGARTADFRLASENRCLRGRKVRTQVLFVPQRQARVKIRAWRTKIFMRMNTTYNFESAVINAAASAYLLLNKEVPQDIVLWEAMEVHRLNPTGMAIAKGGIKKLMSMREIMNYKVAELEAIDQQG